MRRITYTWIVGLCAAWLWQPAMAGTTETKLPDPLPIETMRAAVYTKAFAKRFVLPEPGPGTEPTGAIQGMEFSMEEIPPSGVYARPLYTCDLILYLDNTLPIAWPEEGRAGAQRIMSIHPQLFSHMSRERFLAMSVEDRRHSGSRGTLYNMRARIVTSDFEYPKRGGSFDATYREFDREFYPGVAYLKLDIGCSLAGSQLEKYLAYAPAPAPYVELWLLKTGGRNYTDISVQGVDRNDFVRLPLQRNFLERVLPWIKAGAVYNSKVIDEEIKRNRPQRMKESEKQMKEWNKELEDPEVRRQLGEILRRKP